MNLDEEQKKAADCLNKHSIIISGAGCGKTTTLIGKIENLIRNNIKPSEILVLSFTNETVQNFISRCNYTIKVLTFHKAALEYLDKSYEIAEDYVLNTIIHDFLKQINNKLKIKLFRIWNKYKTFNNIRYNDFINYESAESLFSILKNGCKLIKTNNVDIDKLKNEKFNKNELIILYCIKCIMKLYNKSLIENNMIDFDDMIIYATKNLNKNIKKNNYKHILVDEYQDISYIRFKFLKALINSNKAILTVVGDDWQSIYQFSGSNIALFINFQKHFQNSEKFFITNTYRCPKKLVKLSTKFILKNKFQIKKNIKPINNNKFYYKKVYVNNYQNALYKILCNCKDKSSILVLSRNSFDIQKYLSDKVKYKNEKFIIDGVIKDNIKFMTIHKSKGLESDIVVILNLSSDCNGLPSKKENKLFEKILGYHEPIKHAEERRLFYVALTRAKSKLYLLIDNKKSSIFANET